MAFACPFVIAFFLAHFNSSIPFLSYLQMFTDRLKDEFALSSFLIEFFLRSLIHSAVDYGLTVCFPELKKAESLEQLSHHQTRDAFLTVLLPADTSYLSFRSDIVHSCLSITSPSETLSHSHTNST
jgi:hypothetical protein